ITDYKKRLLLKLVLNVFICPLPTNIFLTQIMQLNTNKISFLGKSPASSILCGFPEREMS
ncbi:MAG: hypothetical protein ACQETL_19395, partial [Bacteroidota bacterium]